MAHVPMDDGRKPELLQLIHLEAHGPGREVEIICDLHQSAQRDPLQRNGVSAPQRVQVNAVAVVRGHHCQTCEPALGGFRLPNHGETGCPVQVQHQSHPHTEQRFDQPLNERTFF